jgi:hypothetical protein
MGVGVVVLLLLPVFLGPAVFWVARARRTAAGCAATGAWASHLLEMSRGALLLVPYGAGVALLGGSAGGAVAAPTVLGVTFAALFGSAIALVGLLAAAPLLAALLRGRGS